jgi:hypothetical protein
MRFERSFRNIKNQAVVNVQEKIKIWIATGNYFQKQFNKIYNGKNSGISNGSLIINIGRLISLP